MAVITRYVVEHKGVEKFVTADKKEADQYDKMLEAADIAVQIRSHVHEFPSLTNAHHKSIIQTEQYGPEGWANTINELLFNT